jgi:hypothetical protein
VRRGVCAISLPCLGIALATGWLSYRAEQSHLQQTAVAALRATGSQVAYDFEYPRNDKSYVRMTRLFGLIECAGVDYFHRPIAFSGDFTRICDDDLKNLERLRALVYVSLRDTNVGDKGLSNIAGLLELRTLNLSGSVGITNNGLSAFRRLTNLKELDLSETAVSDDGLINLAPLEHIEKLRLRSTRVRGTGLKFLEKMRRLRILDLSGTDVSDTAAAYLSKLRNLTYLNLGGTNVSDASVEHLKRLSKLEFLGLIDTKMDVKGGKELERALSKTVIVRWKKGDEVGSLPGAEELERKGKVKEKLP